MIDINEVKKGVVFDIQHYSIHDGPGIRTVVFLKGCPLRCKWCQNPESFRKTPEIMYNRDKCIQCDKCLEVCKHDAIGKVNGQKVINIEKCNLCQKCVDYCPGEALETVGSEMNVDQVIKEIEKDRVFYRKSEGGVTLSGGELTFQPEFSLEILKRCKESYIHTAIETCGYTRWDVLESLLEYIDLVLYDIKGFDKDEHRENTGVDNTIILNNLKFISQKTEVPVVVRIPIIPCYNDSFEEIKRTAGFLKDLKNITEVNLLPYHKLGENKYSKLGLPYNLSNITPPTEEKLNGICSIFVKEKIQVKIGG